MSAGFPDRDPNPPPEIRDEDDAQCRGCGEWFDYHELQNDLCERCEVDDAQQQERALNREYERSLEGDWMRRPE